MNQHQRRAIVYTLSLAGYTQPEIAKRVGVSIKTIARDQKANEQRAIADADAVIQEWRAEFLDMMRELTAKAWEHIPDMPPEDALPALVKIAPLAMRVMGIDQLELTGNQNATLNALKAYGSWIDEQSAAPDTQSENHD